MIEADKKLCEALLSPGAEVGRLSLVAVRRKGALLLALPLGRKLALATLGLYQPQKWKGRMLKSAMSAAVSLGFHRLLPRVEVAVGDRGVLSALGADIDPKKFGFLLGNAEARLRSLIALVDMDGGLYVIKAGCGEVAPIVRDESQAMQKFSTEVGGVPECRDAYEIDGGAAYIAELVQGRSPRTSDDDVLVFALLEDWLGAGKRLDVAGLACWKSLATTLDLEEMQLFADLSRAQVLSPVMHGDFAPWNIKVNGDGLVKVLDWEFASQKGMPGWDWLHYQVQRLRLVKGASAEKIIAACRELLNGAGVKSYLERSGLDGREDALLGSYLYYSGRVHDYPREDLIEVWKSGSQEVRESGS